MKSRPLLFYRKNNLFVSVFIWVALTTDMAQEMLPVICSDEFVGKKLANLFQSAELMKAFAKEPEMYVQSSARFLAFNCTTQSISTANTASQEFSTAAKSILTRIVALRAVRAVWAHAQP